MVPPSPEASAGKPAVMLQKVGPVYSLSIHADYRCRHSGVCCSSDWDIPVELPLYRSLDHALTTGQLAAVAPAECGDPSLLTGPDLPEGTAAIVSRTATGECVFYHGGSGLCVVHRDLGEPMLPPACRHFPRVAVSDARGTFITLTHYCPTAAAMLFRDDVPLEIVEAPAAFPPGDYEGLQVHPDAWPPLLHPRMLMDLDGYSAWERHMVNRLARPISPESGVATLERDARELRKFRADAGGLADAVGDLPADTVEAPAPLTLDASLALHAEVLSTVPENVRPDPDDEGLREAFARFVGPEWSAWHAPARRYLAAKAFASWLAYQGTGVLTIVTGLEAALAFVRVEAARECRNAGRALDADLLKQAFRAADYALNHIAVGKDLAKTWSRVEEGG